MLDLAIQAAGLVSAPLAGSDRTVHLPAWDSEGPDALPDRPAGRVLIAEREVSQEQLLAAASSLQNSLAPGDGKREIAVLGRSPELGAARALLSWSTVNGAALLLSPSPDSLVGSAVWARPTLFCGNALEVSALRRAAEEERPPFWVRRKGRLPFGRLRTVLWTEGPPSEADRGYWESRGVRTGVLAAV